jgi:hypothetical protein
MMGPMKASSILLLLPTQTSINSHMIQRQQLLVSSLSSAQFRLSLDNDEFRYASC